MGSAANAFKAMLSGNALGKKSGGVGGTGKVFTPGQVKFIRGMRRVAAQAMVKAVEARLRALDIPYV